MADQDPYSAFGGSAVPAPATPPSPAQSDDPYAAFGGKSITAPATTAEPASDPYSQFGGKAATAKPAPDPNQSLIGKAWDWANTPLININKSNEGGFTGGLEDVASGLTSPLSIGLTAATLGGGAILRGLGLAAEETPLVIRGIKSLLDAGFTAQGAYQVAKESPRVLDALKEGDYETAKRLAVHVAAGTAMTGLGTAHVFEDAAPFGRDVAAGLGFKVKPSETNRTLGRFEGERRAEREGYQDFGKKFVKEAKEKYPDHTPEDNAAAFHYMDSGGNAEYLARLKNHLMDSADRPDLKVAEPATALTEEETAINEKLKADAAEQRIKKSYTPEEVKFVSDSFDKAIAAARKEPGTETIQSLGTEAREAFKIMAEKAESKGILKKFVENYITHIWKKEDVDNPAANLLRDASNTGKFQTNVSMALKRSWQNAVEGMLYGRKLATTEPAALVGNYASKIGDAISNRNLKEKILGLRTSDGSPGAMLSGAGSVVENDHGDPAVLVNPKITRNVVIDDAELQQLKDKGVLDKLLASEKIKEVPVKDSTTGEKFYVWNHHGYMPIGDLEDWRYAAHAPDGTPVHVKSSYVVHPEMYDMVNRLIGGEKSTIQSSPPLRWLLNASSEAKHMMLSYSPFHIAQVGLRSLMQGVLPTSLERMDINESPVLQRLVENGLVRGKEHLSLDDFVQAREEGLGGHSKIINAIGKAGDKLGVVGKPLSVLRDVQNYTTEFLFDKLLPVLKEQNAMKLYDRWSEKLKDDDFFSKLQKDHEEFRNMDKENAAAKLAALETNERFGGLNYKMMGRAVGTQDFLRLATLAPDWLESEIRSLKRVFDPTAGVMARRDVVRLTAGMWVTARVLNMLLTHKMHNEAPLGVVHVDANGKEKEYSLRTLPTDMLHAATDPVGFLRGRASPLVRTASEAYTQRDYQGRKLTPGAAAVDIIRNNFTPIPAQAIGKSLTGASPDLTTPDQAVKALGGTATVYRTQAQKLANELAANKTESGPVDSNKLARHRMIVELEDSMRAGRASVDSLNNLKDEGHISESEARSIHKNVQETREMDPELAKLYTRATRLPMKDFLQIWDVATPNEQTALAKLLVAKQKRYMKTVNKELSPDERRSDPTYQRLKTMFPGAPTF